jgi:hypothetical protein
MSAATNVRDDYVARISAFCKREGISEDKFGKLYCNGDHHAIPWLRKGRATLKRLEAINAVLRASENAEKQAA